MEYTQLGRSGLQVSRLCLGTMNFGQATDEADSHPIMDAAHEYGINYFDTANVYGNKGGTEQIVGAGSPPEVSAASAPSWPRRCTATLVTGPTTESSRRSASVAPWTRALARLQTDYIDIYQFHHVDRQTPWDEIWQAMETAVAQGKILYAGSSNFAGWHIPTAQAEARRRNFTGTGQRAVDLQPAHPGHRARGHSRRAGPTGSGLIPWSPLHGGLLGGVLGQRPEASGGVRIGWSRRWPSIARRSNSTRSSPPTWATRRATSGWRGCCTNRR